MEGLVCTGEEVMIRYLRLVNKWMHNLPSALILDQYPSHMTEAVLSEANKLRIKLIFIPKSATDVYQPLDRRVFGTLKSMASAIFADDVFYHGTAYTKPQAADLFMRCWKRMGRNVITSAWTFDDESHSSDDDSDASSSDTDFKQYDSDYDSEEEEVSDEIDAEEIRLLNRSSKEPKLTPPRPRPRPKLIDSLFKK